MSDDVLTLLALCVAGIGAGLILLWRGFGGYRTAARIGDTSTSRIATLAAGEVRISGTIEPAEVLLVSPLQGRECVWYRASISSADDSETGQRSERGVGFRVRDDTGTIRVFPRGARMDVPDRFDDRSDAFGEPPPGLDMRHQAMVAADPLLDREAAIARLLTVHQPDRTVDADGLVAGAGGGQRRYREARLEPGDVVTAVGAARPFGQLDDPAGADSLDAAGDAGLNDPTVASDLAAARAAGALLPPDEAWGNAAIPGFGIGRPTRPPQLDPRATPETLASPDDAARIERTFDIEPDLLVLASSHEVPLLIASGSPADATAREQGRFLLGLLGAVLAIGSAVAAAWVLTAR